MKLFGSQCKELETLAKQHPEAIKDLKYIGHPNRYPVGYIAADAKEKALLLNKEYFGRNQREKFTNLIKKQHQEKFFVPKTISGVIAHEYGHFIDGFYTNKGGAISTFWNNWKGKYMKELTTDALKSRYELRRGRTPHINA